MPSVNKVILVGYLGKDPEMKHLSNGDAVCNLSLATSESWKDKSSGEKREATEWHRLTMFRRTAEVAGQYLKKGSLIYVEGRLKTSKWQKDGQDHYSTDVIVDAMKMLGGKGEGGGRSSSSSQQEPAGRAGADTIDEEIPF